VTGVVRRVLRSLLLLVLGLVLVTAAGLTWIGFPPALVRHLLASVNAGEYFCQVRSMALDWRGGLVAREVRLYRKGMVGAPFVEARQVKVLFHPLLWPRTGQNPIKSIVARHGTVRNLPFAAGTGAGPAGDVELVVRLDDFDVLGTWIEQASGSVRVGPKGGSVTRLSGLVGQDQQRGEVHGTCSWEWREGLQGQFVTSFDPHALMPLCRAFDLVQVHRVMEWFSFSAGPPDCEVTVDCTAGERGRLAVKGRVQASDFAYRGVGIAFANVGVSYERVAERRRMVLNPAMLVMGGRNVTGNVAIDFSAGRVDLEAVSTADIPSLARMVGWGTSGMGDWHFGRGTRVYAKGVIGYDDPSLSDLEASVEGAHIGIGPLVADECSFRYLVKGETNRLTDIRGKIGGGSFTGNAMFTPVSRTQPAGTRYTVKGEVINVDFQRLRSLLNTNAGVRADGKLYGSVEVSGLTGSNHLASLTGQGFVNMRRGVVFRLPLFGGMTDALTKAVPGLDFALKQTDVHTPFEIRNGRISSQDVQIEGDVLSLTAKGDYRMEDGALAFDVQVRPMKDKTLLGQAMRALAYPISRLFEFRLEGTLDRPRWSVFNLRHETGRDEVGGQGAPLP
jgi:hypothetical protein